MYDKVVLPSGLTSNFERLVHVAAGRTVEISYDVVTKSPPTIYIQIYGRQERSEAMERLSNLMSRLDPKQERLVFRWMLSTKAMTVLPFSLNELISLLKSMRLGWGPPLELVTRTSKQLWVMEADVWADLLIVCCWANPTTIYCQDCGEDVDLTTTSCNHAVCFLCIAKQKSRPRSCPECGQTLTALIFTSALATEQEELTRKRRLRGSTTAATKRSRTSSGKSKSTIPGRKATKRSPLTTSDLQKLFVTLFPARTSWFNLGLALKVPCETLEDIRIKQREDSGNCLREMLITRLKEELSKEEVVSALDTPTVERHTLAREAEQTL